MQIDYSKLIWQSDCSGEEAGFDDVLIVGIYLDPQSGNMLLIDMEKNEIIKEYGEEED